MRQFFAILGALVFLSAAQPVMAHTINSNAAQTTSAVNMRSCAGTHCHRILTVPGWSQVRLRGCNHRWCKVRYHGHVGYVSARYLRVNNPRHRHNNTRRPRNGYRQSGSVQLNGSDAVGVAAALAAGYIIYRAIND